MSWHFFAENMDPISGGGGWVGAGLLGAVLTWLCLKYLPDKDRQAAERDRLWAEAMRDKDDKQAKIVDDLRLAHAKALSDTNDKHLKAVERVVEHCRSEVKTEREASERRHQEVMAFLGDIHRGTREGVHATRNLSNSWHMRQRLADAFQSAEVPAWTKDLNGVLQSWNPACERVFGWKQGEVVGKSVYDTVIPPERKEEEDDVLRHVTAGESVPPYDTVRLGKGGKRIAVTVTTSPVRDQTGQVVGASTVVHPYAPNR